MNFIAVNSLQLCYNSELSTVWLHIRASTLLYPVSRWSIQRANGQYRDHLVGQLTTSEQRVVIIQCSVDLLHSAVYSGVQPFEGCIKHNSGHRAVGASSKKGFQGTWVGSNMCLAINQSTNQWRPSIWRNLNKDIQWHFDMWKFSLKYFLYKEIWGFWPRHLVFPTLMEKCFFTNTFLRTPF